MANITGELRFRGFEVAETTVRRQLRALGYSLQANRKSNEGADHPDRDAQLRHIAEVAAKVLFADEPVISGDTKKKGLVGNYKSQGRELAPTGTPIHVNTHDFKDAGLGKAIPYGIYDLGRDEGCVSVGIAADTAQFAVGSIEAWWRSLGRKLSIDWRAKPLVSRQAGIDLIAATRTSTGLTVHARLDRDTYATRIYVAEEEMDALRIDGDGFHPEWNYTITPRG